MGNAGIRLFLKCLKINKMLSRIVLEMGQRETWMLNANWHKCAEWPKYRKGRD